MKSRIQTQTFQIRHRGDIKKKTRRILKSAKNGGGRNVPDCLHVALVAIPLHLGPPHPGYYLARQP